MFNLNAIIAAAKDSIFNPSTNKLIISEGKTYSGTYTKKDTRARKRSHRPSDRTKSSDELHLHGKSKLARKALRGRLGL